MGQTHELVVEVAVLAEAADGHAHTAVDVAVKSGLRTVILLEVSDELLGGVGQLQLLGQTLEVSPCLQDLLLGGLVLELYEHSRSVAVGDGHADALGGDEGSLGLDDDTVLNGTPDAQGLLLGLLLLAADVGDHVVDHLGPLLEGLACTGNGLVGGGHHQGGLELHEGGQSGHVGLDGAVGLHGDEAALRAQSGSLCLNDGQMLGVDLGDHHGHVGGPAVGRVVGDHGDLGAGVLLLQSLDLVLLHIYGAEHEGALFLHGLDVVLGIHHDHVLVLLGHGDVQLPAVAHGLGVGLACGAGGGGQGGDLKVGVIVQQGQEALAYHTGSAHHADLHLCVAHCMYLVSWDEKINMLHYITTRGRMQ